MSTPIQLLLHVEGLSKGFTMHLLGGIDLPVVHNAEFEVSRGECVVLGGPSGAGKSSILKMVYGNYKSDIGHILVNDGNMTVDVASADPRSILALRRTTIGYVSQFLSVIPRVSALDLVAQVAVDWGDDKTEARAKAATMLARLNIPERLWALPPATFSGGEQQRVNIARGFIGCHPLLLLDEPTASLDATNSQVVLDLIKEKKSSGAGMLGIFHDPNTRQAVADRVIDVTTFAAAA